MRHKYRMIFKILLRWIIPLGISGLALWLVLRNIDFASFSQNLMRVGWQAILFATAAYFTSFFFRTLCWFILLRRKVPFKDVFFTLGAGYLLNNIFPFRLGEIGRAVLLDDPDGISGLEVLSSIVVERVFDVFLAAIFILAMLPRIFDHAFDQDIIIVVFILAGGGLVSLYLVAMFRAKISMWLSSLGNKTGFIQAWLTPKVTKLMEGLSILTHPIAFLTAFASLTISWFLAFGQNYIIFRSLYPDPPFWWMIFVLSAAAFGAALPSAPAGWGVFEGVKVAAFALLGVNPEVALTLAIVVHLMAFIYASLIGLIGLRLRGEAVMSFYQRVIRKKPEAQLIE